MNPAFRPTEPPAYCGRRCRQIKLLTVSFRTARNPRPAALVRYLTGISLGLLTLLVAAPLAAQEFTAEGFRVTAAAGREVMVLSSDAGSLALAQPEVAGFTAQSYETASQRIHVVSFEGETFRAATPVDGPWSRIVFDPSRRTFVPLLPSIRVELNDSVQIDAVAAAVDATGVTIFESLGFAIVELPEELHPANAVARVVNVLGQPGASVRLRRPEIEWR